MRTRVLYIQTHSLSTHRTRKPGSLAITSSSRCQFRDNELLQKRQFSKSHFPQKHCYPFPTPVPTLQQPHSRPNSNRLARWFISDTFIRTAMTLNSIICHFNLYHLSMGKKWVQPVPLGFSVVRDGMLILVKQNVMGTKGQPGRKLHRSS